MRGRHIALFPLPSKGHINPFLALCPELIRRGYRVTLVTDERHANLVPPAGAEPVIVDTSKAFMKTSATDGWEGHDPRWWDVIGGVILPWLLNSAAVAACQVDTFYRKNRPDLIIYDSCAYAGRIVGKRFSSPVVQYYCDLIYHSGHFCWEHGVGYTPQLILEFDKLLNSFLWAYGFEETNSFWHSDDLNICPFPREFHYDVDSIDSDRFCFAGPFLDRPFSPIWKNRSNGKRIVLVSAITGSTDADYFNTIIEALGGSEYHVILSVGEHFPMNNLHALPKNFEINSFASHLEILPNVDLHLYSGGAGGTLEGFFFGVPLIAVPSFGPNYKIANRLAELGVALNLSLHGMTGQAIRDNVARALHDEAFLGRVRQIQSVVRNQGGSATAVDRIENFLAERG